MQVRKRFGSKTTRATQDMGDRPLRRHPRRTPVSQGQEPERSKAPSSLAGRTSKQLALQQNTHIPLYLQFERLIKELMADGSLPAGTRLPSEEELVASYGISRVTVRKALGRLAGEELVARQQGKGTFVVSPQKIQQPLGQWMSLNEVFRSAGAEAKIDVIYRGMAPTPESVCTALRLPQGSKALRLMRRYRVRSGAITLVDSWLHPQFAALLDDQDLREGSVYRILVDAGVRLTSRRQRITAMAAPREVADALEIVPGTSVLVAENHGFASSTEPVDSSCIYYNPLLYSLVLEQDLSAATVRSTALDSDDEHKLADVNPRPTSTHLLISNSRLSAIP